MSSKTSALIRPFLRAQRSAQRGATVESVRRLSRWTKRLFSVPKDVRCVYLYINPLDGKVFYVGKGKGNRTFKHLRHKMNSQVTSTIKKIQKMGTEPFR